MLQAFSKGAHVHHVFVPAQKVDLRCFHPLLLGALLHGSNALTETTTKLGFNPVTAGQILAAASMQTRRTPPWHVGPGARSLQALHGRGVMCLKTQEALAQLPRSTAVAAVALISAAALLHRLVRAGLSTRTLPLACNTAAAN